jgi:hypothetical protein
MDPKAMSEKLDELVVTKKFLRLTTSVVIDPEPPRDFVTIKTLPGEVLSKIETEMLGLKDTIIAGGRALQLAMGPSAKSWKSDFDFVCGDSPGIVLSTMNRNGLYLYSSTTSGASYGSFLLFRFSDHYSRNIRVPIPTIEEVMQRNSIPFSNGVDEDIKEEILQNKKLISRAGLKYCADSGTYVNRTDNFETYASRTRSKIRDLYPDEISADVLFSAGIGSLVYVGREYDLDIVKTAVLESGNAYTVCAMYPKSIEMRTMRHVFDAKMTFNRSKVSALNSRICKYALRGFECDTTHKWSHILTTYYSLFCINGHEVAISPKTKRVLTAVSAARDFDENVPEET